MKHKSRMKRLAALLSGLVIAAGLCVSAASAAFGGQALLPDAAESGSELTAAFDRLTYEPGDTVTVDFILRGEDFDAAGFCVTFDSEELTYRSCVAGDGLSLPVLRAGADSLEVMVQADAARSAETGVVVAQAKFTAVTSGGKTLAFANGSAVYLGGKSCVAYNGYRETDVTPQVAEDAAADALLRQAKTDAVNALTADVEAKLASGVTVAQRELLARCLQQGRAAIHNAMTAAEVSAALNAALDSAAQIAQETALDHPRLTALTNGIGETDPLEADLYPEFSPENTAYFLYENRPLDGIPHAFRAATAAGVSVTFNGEAVSVASDGSFTFSVPFQSLENVNTLLLTDDATGLRTAYLFISCGYGVSGGPTGVAVYNENGETDNTHIGQAERKGPVLRLSTSTDRVRIGFGGTPAANKVFQAELVDSTGRVLQTFTAASDDDPKAEQFLSDPVTLRPGLNWLLLRYYGENTSKWVDGKPARTPGCQTVAIVIQYTDPEAAEKDPSLTDTTLTGIHIRLEGSQEVDRMVTFDPVQRKYQIELDARDFDTALSQQAVRMTVDKRPGQTVRVYGGNGAAQERRLLRDGTYHIADYLDTEVPRSDKFTVTVTVTAKDGQHTGTYTLTFVKKGMAALIVPQVYRDREVIITPNSPHRTWNLTFASIGITDEAGSKISVSAAMDAGLLTMELSDPEVISWDGVTKDGSFIVELCRQGETAIRLLYDDGSGTPLEETVYLSVNYSADVLKTTLDSARKMLSDTSRKYAEDALRHLRQTIKAEEQTYEKYKEVPRRNLTQPQIQDINRGVNALLDAMQELIYAEVAEEIIAFVPLDPEIAYQEVENSITLRHLNLPDSLQVTLSDGTETTLSGITWRSDPEYKAKQEEAKKYKFTPILPAGYKPARGVEPPVIWISRAEMPFVFDVRRWALPEVCTDGRLLVPLGTADAADIMQLRMQAHVRGDAYTPALTKWEDVSGFDGHQTGQYIFRAALIENELDPATNMRFIWSSSVPENRRTMDMVVYVFDLTMKESALTLAVGSQSDAPGVAQENYPANAVTAGSAENLQTVRDCLEWTSSVPDVLAVDPSTGRMTAKASGTATVTAKLTGTDLSASCQVSVVLDQVTVEPQVLSLAVNATGRLTLKEKLPRSAPVSWASEREDVATVDKNGLVTAHEVGQSKITVTAILNGRTLTGTALVTVTSGSGTGGDAPGTMPSGGTGTLQGQPTSGGEYRDLLTDPEGTGTARPAQNASSADPEQPTPSSDTPGSGGTGTGGRRIFAVDGPKGDTSVKEILLMVGATVLLLLCGVLRGRKVLGGTGRAKKSAEKLTALVLAAGLLLAGLPTSAYAATESGGEPAGHIVLSIEKLTLGQGFILEPQQVPYYSGENLAQVLDRVLSQQGIDYRSTGTLTGGFYLAELEDPARPGIADTVPVYIYDMWASLKASSPSLRGIADTDTQEPDYLGEFDYFSQSGWMYSVNHVFLPVGAADCRASDGMVVRWQFSLVGLGGDLGGGNTTAAGSREFMNRTELYTVLAAVRADAALMADSKVRPLYDRLLAQSRDITTEESAVQDDIAALKKALGGNQITALSLPDGESGLRSCPYGTTREEVLRDLPTYLKATIDGAEKLVTGITWTLDARLDAPGAYVLRPVLPEKYSRYTLMAALPLIRLTLQPPSGDINGDTQLDLRDLSLLVSAAGRKDRPACDLDGNGIVTWNDFRLLAASIGAEALLSGGEAENTPLSVTFDRDSYRAGETATAYIRADGAGFDTLALHLTFSAQQLRVQDAALAQPLLQTACALTEGSVRLGGASLEKAAAVGEIAAVTFTVLEDCAPTAALQSASLLYSGASVAENAGRLTALYAAGNAAPLPGDLDESGTVDMDDAIRLVEYCNGRANLSDGELMAADVNGDGAVDLRDAALLLQYCNGLINALPVHCR